MPNEVQLAIEGNKESYIQEIALNGQETWIQPLSMSEKLQRATQRIDFYKELNGDEVDEEDSKKDEPQENPWEGVRKNIVDALTEVRVLHDVLAILSHDPAMPVPPGLPGQPPLQPPPNQQKILKLSSAQQPILTAKQIQNATVIAVQAKKKALKLAGETILKGAERLQKPTEKINDFHQELLLLRQHYRLRRHGEKILGDLSFRTAGSMFNEQSTFEVIRDTDCKAGTSPLRVRLPTELQSMIWISIRVEQCVVSDVLSQSNPPNNSLSTYQYILENLNYQREFLSQLKQAQNGLFCRELFDQLCREAATYRPIVPIYVIGDTITTQIFPDTKFIIQLQRRPFKVGERNMESFDKENDRRWYCLEQLLNKTLREQHAKDTSLPAPHPTIATMGMNRKQRTAATKPYTRIRIDKMRKVVPLLQQIIEAAKHSELLRRVEYQLDELARAHHQPNIHIHWPVVQNQVHTSLKVHFSCSGYEMCTKQFGMHSILLNIGIDKCQAVQRDGSVVELGSDPQELKRLMEGELLAQQIACIAGLSRIIDWTVLSSRRGAILLSPPVSSECYAGRVAVRTEDNQLRVFVESREASNLSSDIILEQRWQLLHSNKWREVEWEKLPGMNFVAKIEQMLACLSLKVSDIVSS